MGQKVGAEKSSISIHALREEGDLAVLVYCHIPKAFLSTPSARRATAGILMVNVSLAFLSTPSARRATVLCSAECECL